MSAVATPKPSPVRDRILATAMDLFYRQGYHATGINQIIAESGVAKASFYDHFPSKEALLHEYLREIAEKEFAETEAAVRALPTALERFFGPFGVLIPWFECSDYRGCPFQNILAESPPEDPLVRQLALVHRENIRGLIRDVSEDLFAERPELKDRDMEKLIDLYLVLFEGAIVTSVAYRAPWPVETAKRHLEEWLGLS